MSRWTTIGVLSVAAVGIAYWYVSAPGTPVDVAVVQTGPIRAYIEERAKTRLPKIYRITMPLDGRIEPITLKEGDHVTKGQVVARMDAADLQTDLTAATARVNQFDELLKSLNMTVLAAKAQTAAGAAKVAYADREYKRQSGLAERKVVSDVERRKAELLQVQSRFENKRDELIAQSIVAIAAATSLAKQDAAEQQKRRQRDRDRVLLKCPVEGIVLSRRISNRRVLSAGEVLLEVGQMQTLEIEAEILTQDAVRIQQGDRVDIEGAAVGSRPVHGRVSRIYPRGFTKVSSLGVEQQRVLVIVRFDEGELSALEQAGRTLRADYRVRVKIYTDEKTDVLKIPRSALFRGTDGLRQVFVVRGGRARQVDVTIGLTNDFEVEVLSGLEQGDQVIVAPESSLTTGRRVEPQTAQ